MYNYIYTTWDHVTVDGQDYPIIRSLCGWSQWVVKIRMASFSDHWKPHRPKTPSDTSGDLTYLTINNRDLI